MGSEVPLVAAEPTSPSFPTTLSPSDRRLLALAFFFSSLDGDPDLPGHTLVFDDPACGLDKRRKTRVVDAVMGFAGRVQIVVLSHDADFVRMLRDRGLDSVLQLRRSGVYCVIEDCDIDAVCAMDYVEHRGGALHLPDWWAPDVRVTGWTSPADCLNRPRLYSSLNSAGRTQPISSSCRVLLHQSTHARVSNSNSSRLSEAPRGGSHLAEADHSLALVLSHASPVPTEVSLRASSSPVRVADRGTERLWLTRPETSLPCVARAPSRGHRGQDRRTGAPPPAGRR